MRRKEKKFRVTYCRLKLLFVLCGSVGVNCLIEHIILTICLGFYSLCFGRSLLLHLLLHRLFSSVLLTKSCHLILYVWPHWNLCTCIYLYFISLIDWYFIFSFNLSRFRRSFQAWIVLARRISNGCAEGKITPRVMLPWFAMLFKVRYIVLAWSDSTLALYIIKVKMLSKEYLHMIFRFWICTNACGVLPFKLYQLTDVYCLKFWRSYNKKFFFPAKSLKSIKQSGCCFPCIMILDRCWFHVVSVDGNCIF